MKNLGIALIGLAALAFILAVVAALFAGKSLGVPPEAFSRASGNLALLAIALGVWLKCGSGKD